MLILWLQGHIQRIMDIIVIVEFLAPGNCHSVKIVSSHKVLAFGQTWSTKTSATY